MPWDLKVKTTSGDVLVFKHEASREWDEHASDWRVMYFLINRARIEGDYLLVENVRKQTLAYIKLSSVEYWRHEDSSRKA